MLSNNGLCLTQLDSTCYYFQYGSIILTGFKFTQLHTLTLATCSYALLLVIGIAKRKFGKYTYKTMMGRKNKISHTGRVPSTAAVFPRLIATAALCIRK